MTTSSAPSSSRRVSFGLVILSSLLAGCASDRKVIDNAEKMNTQLQPAVIRDPTLANYLQKVGDRIIASARDLQREGVAPKANQKGDSSWMFSEKMKFHLVNSKTLNAFTTGGEHMYIYTGLFQQCTSEDELAAVMAHEFAHIYGRHIHKGMDRQMGALAIAAGAAAGGAAIGGKDNWAEGAAAGGGIGLMAAQFMNMGFTRKDEAEADEYGFHFYVRSGWDPYKFGDFFQHMADKGYDKTPEMLSDHPTLRSRVVAAKERASKLPPSAAQYRRAGVASDAEFKKLIARTIEVGKTLPTDKTLSDSQELLQALPRSCVAPVEPKDVNEARERIVKRAHENQQQQQPQ